MVKHKEFFVIISAYDYENEESNFIQHPLLLRQKQTAYSAVGLRDLQYGGKEKLTIAATPLKTC